MKCPKCGYNSFDDLDSCRKCGVDLAEHKNRFGLGGLFFAGGKPAAAEPAEAQTQVAPEAAATAEEALLTEAGDPTDFGFDFLESEPAPEETTAAAALTEVEQHATPAAGTDDGDFFAEESDAFVPPLPTEDLDHLDDDPGIGPEDDAFTLANFDEEQNPFAAERPAPGDNPEAEAGTQRRPAHPEPPEGPDPFEQGGSAPGRRSPLAENDSLPSPEPADPFWSAPDAATWTLSTGEAIPPLEGIQAPAPTLRAAAEQQQVAEPSVAEPPPPSAGVELPENTSGSAAAELSTAEETETAAEAAAPAPLISRLAATLADLLILAGIFVLFLLVGDQLLHPGSELLPAPKSLLNLAIPYFLFFFTTGFGYFTLFHLLLGQTPGKMLFGLGVESGLGGPLEPAQAFLRSVGGLAALTAGGLGFLPSLADPEGRGWNDRLADTRVVRWRPAASATATADRPASEA